MRVREGIGRSPPYSMYAVIVLSIAAAGAAHAVVPYPAVGGALESGRLGLYAAGEFRLTDGRCQDCSAIPQALWYFQGDLIAVPKERASGFTRMQRAQDDVRKWAAEHPAKGDGDKPPLLWIGSPQIASGVRLTEGGESIVGPDGKRMGFSVTPKIPSNLSYYDASSVHYFSDRPLRMRGKLDQGKFTARTLWPEDFALNPARMAYQPLADEETLQSLVRAEGGGGKAPFASRILWQRDAKSPLQLAGKPVMAFMLNGAQGDDDEAHGGHFAIATGAIGEHGEWGDWLVNNFYNLDSVSEKGIVAATLPMDAYMADLNSGQSWYRPSYMLVAVLKQDRTAGLYQEAINRVYNHFYRHDFHYRHTTANCAGVSMETLRSLGWNIPEQGPTSRLKAAIALPYMAVKDMSLESGKKAYDYLIAERTDLYPFVAFEAAGHDLLQRVAVGGKASSAFEKMMADDLEALIYVRIPQFPSSREFGQAPVASIDEYMKRAPEDQAQWKIVPVPPRPFPPELKDPDVPAEESLPSSFALYAYGGIFGISAVGAWRRRSGKRAAK